MAKVKLLIVESQILLANDIAKKLSDNNYDIIGTAASANKALELLASNQDIDIILIDIMLKGELDGIELARLINDNYGIPFIFLTAHDDNDIIYRVKSVKPYAYLVKPITNRQACIAIELALKNFSNKISKNEMFKKRNFSSTEKQELNNNDCLFLKKDSHFERVRIIDILFLQLDGNYYRIYTKIGLFSYSMDLNKLEEQLPTNRFIRVHRNYVVNINSVNGFEGNFLYIGDNKIPVSKSFREDVFKFFKSI